MISLKAKEQYYKTDTGTIGIIKQTKIDGKNLRDINKVSNKLFDLNL